MKSIILKPNDVQVDRDLSVINESILQMRENVFNNKLLLHESFNDAYQIRNIDAVALAIAEYTNNMKEVLEKEHIIIDNIFKELGTSSSNIENIVLESDILQDCSDDELGKIKFSLYNYNVNTHLIKYIDVNDMITTYRRDSLNGITENELDDLEDNKESFLSYVMKLASEINDRDLTMKNYRDELRKFLRGDADKEVSTLSKTNLNMLLDLMDNNNKLKDYLNTEYSRLKEFIETIMNFADTINHNELLMNAMNPNVSINKQNWKMARQASRSDSFEMVRDYIINLFDIFNKCIEIYTITIAETAICMKDMVSDVSNILTIVINMKKDTLTDKGLPGEIIPTFIDSVSGNNYYSMNYDDVETINECILELSTYKIESILTESADVLLEAGNAKNAMINALKSLKNKIIELSNKFKDLADRVMRENSAWVKTIKSINAMTLKSDRATKPFYDNFEKVRALRVPSFNPNDAVYSASSPDEFYEKYYSNIDTSDNLSKLYNQFMANDKQDTKLTGKTAMVFQKCVKIIDSYTSAVNKLHDENRRLGTLLDKYNSSTINESALLEMSLFPDDYYYYLFEAAGPVTPDDIDKKTNNDNNGNKDTNNTTDSTPNKDNSDEAKKASMYVTWVYGIQSIRMRAIEGMYTSAITLIRDITKDKSSADKIVKKAENEKETKK